MAILILTLISVYGVRKLRKHRARVRYRGLAVGLMPKHRRPATATATTFLPLLVGTAASERHHAGARPV